MSRKERRRRKFDKATKEVIHTAIGFKIGKKYYIDKGVAKEVPELRREFRKRYVGMRWLHKLNNYYFYKDLRVLRLDIGTALQREVFPTEIFYYMDVPKKEK